MTRITTYQTFSGKSFSNPVQALSQEHDDCATEINEIIKKASVKDYFVPHEYLVQLVLAFAPLTVDGHGNNGPSLGQAKMCRDKVEKTIDILSKYSSSLSDYMKYMEEDF